MDQSASLHPPLPNSFSQLSLQDYVNCRRCFQLRHVFKLQWPAVESEPAIENERAMQQGAQFHRLVQQRLLGIPVDRLNVLARSEGLDRWWQNFLYFQSSAGLPTFSMQQNPLGLMLYPEMTLATSLHSRAGKDHRLIAKYDLLVVRPDGHLTIYDWKTSGKRPRRSWLLERLQTRVYPYVLSCAGAHLLPQGAKLAPEHIEMVYWFAEDPENPERIVYGAEKFEQDTQYLTGLVDEIVALAPGNFNLTTHEEHCRFCTYRSLCNRGKAAGDVAEMEGELQVVASAEFDFEQIAEIAF